MKEKCVDDNNISVCVCELSSVSIFASAMLVDIKIVNSYEREISADISRENLTVNFCPVCGKEL